jgi:hypothetical protein
MLPCLFIVSIHIAREGSVPMQSITEVRAFPGRELEGDRYFAGTVRRSRRASRARLRRPITR